MEKNTALEILVNLTNTSLGYVPSTPSEFMDLCRQIEYKTGRPISLATIKRIWGYVRYEGFPSVATLNNLARYNGYRDWHSFMLTDTEDGALESSYVDNSMISTDELNVGDCLLLEWGEGKACEIECLGEMRFRVNESSDRRIETLCKAGNIEAVKYFIAHPYSLNKCWNSYKIASRHGYKIEDYYLWCDLINLLDKCGKDINNTRFISPIDLRKEHDFWLDKARKMEMKKQQEERLMRDKENEENFFKTKSKFFGIVIKDDDIEISVLDSIDAFKEEGDAMHHCVFNCQYYSKENSLILSARDTKGNRIETVEFSLTENRVIQSRGFCNSETDYHDRIVNLINNNAYRFIKAKVTA